MSTSDSPSSSSATSPQANQNTEVYNRYHSGRTIKSCTECRRRKMRCSRSRPCQTCSRFNRKCVYLPDPKQTHTTSSDEHDISLSEKDVQRAKYTKGSATSDFNVSRSRLPSKQQPMRVGPVPFNEDDSLSLRNTYWGGDSSSQKARMLRVADRMAWPTRPQLTYEVNKAPCPSTNGYCRLHHYVVAFNAYSLTGLRSPLQEHHVDTFEQLEAAQHLAFTE